MLGVAPWVPMVIRAPLAGFTMEPEVSNRRCSSSFFLGVNGMERLPVRRVVHI